MNHVSTYKILDIRAAHKNRMHTFKCFSMTTRYTDLGYCYASLTLDSLEQKKNSIYFHSIRRTVNTIRTTRYHCTLHNHNIDCCSLGNIFFLNCFINKNASNAKHFLSDVRPNLMAFIRTIHYSHGE